MRTMDEIEYLNAENGNLKKRIKSLEEDAEIRCNTMCKLYERINELELTAKSFDAEIARSHEKIKEAESKWSQLGWENDALKDECNKADERIQKLTNENADFVMEAEKLQERIKELEDELQVSNRCTKDARERTKELEAVISKMETSQPKWISVKDRLPTKKDANRCLDIFVTTNKCPNGFCCYYKDIEEVNATHWMPLPSAPKSEESSSVKEG